MTKTTVMVLGLLMVLLGIWGFFTDSVLGAFEVGAADNYVYLVIGLLGVFAAFKGMASSHMFAKVFGVIIAILSVWGLALGEGTILGLLQVNNADNYLHVVFALVLLFAGFTKPVPTTTPMGSSM